MHANHTYIATHDAMTCERWMRILCTSSKLRYYNYGVSLKLSAMLDVTKIIIMKRHIMSEKHSHIGYWRTDTRFWHHHTITVQGIRNDD